MWINATFPHANHTYLNRCRPATPSMMIGACLEVYLPHDLAVDLVLLEVSTCETSSNHKTQLCYSQFLYFYQAVITKHVCVRMCSSCH